MLHIILVTILTFGAIGVSRQQTEEPPADSRSSVQQQSASQAPDKTPQSGSIRGRVIGEGGRAVADASILAVPINLTSNPQAMITSLLRPVTSDADGKFDLRGLQPGVYSLSASALGYVLSDSGARPFYRTGETVTLTLVKGAVITGRVTSSSGEPLVGMIVRAIKVRDPDNKPTRPRINPMSEFYDSMSLVMGNLGPFTTDDRGIYRIYGLEAGYYQVAAGGRSSRGINLGGTGPYDGDAATYYPSSTIDTAAEVTVRAGDEATSIDIRYRENHGHSISGTVLGAGDSNRQSIEIFLNRVGSGILESTTYVFPMAKEKGFAFDALLDGEYSVIAMAESGSMIEGAETMSALLSPTRKVRIAGADVSGLELRLEPLASMSGRISIEPISATQKSGCKRSRSARLEEVVISHRSDTDKKREEQSIAQLAMLSNTTPNEKGEFTSGFLRPGIHHLDLQLPGDDLYLRTIVLPAPAPNGKPVDLARSGINLKSGEKLKGIVVTMSEGAAGLQGKVVTGKDNQPPETRLRVHLVPAEPEASNDVLRYFESELSTDGGFSFSNVAPGKYWVVAREISDQDVAGTEHLSLAWDDGDRTALRFEGEATKKVIELDRCQRATDFTVTYVPLVKATKPAAKTPR